MSIRTFVVKIDDPHKDNDSDWVQQTLNGITDGLLGGARVVEVSEKPLSADLDTLQADAEAGTL
jgi:hypothetical protein